MAKNFTDARPLLIPKAFRIENQHFMNIQDMPVTVLSRFCELLALDPIDVVNFSRTCRSFHAASSICNPAWQRICENKWNSNALNYDKSSYRTTYKDLFLSSNFWGWLSTTSKNKYIYVTEPPHADRPMYLAASCDHHSNDSLYTATAYDGSISIQKIYLDTQKQQPNTSIDDTATVSASIDILHEFIIPSKIHPNVRITHTASSRAFNNNMDDNHTNALISAVKLLDPERGLVALGTVSGRVSCLSISESLIDEDSMQSIQLDPGEAHCIISQLEYKKERHPTALLALYDRIESTAQSFQAGSCRIYDIEKTSQIHAFTEMLDYYALCAVEPKPNDPNVYFGASVKLKTERFISGYVACSKCSSTLPRALCHHQHRSSQAAISVFDTRADVGMVQRHPLTRRSIYPRMQIVRDHYLLMSHAGEPFTIWDVRNMWKPISSQNFLCTSYNDQKDEGDAYINPSALYLSVCPDGNFLSGRDEHGTIFIFDLSTILGWQCPGPGYGTKISSNVAPASTCHVPPPLPPTPSSFIACHGDHTHDLEDPDRYEQSAAGFMYPRPAVWMGKNWVVAPTMVGNGHTVTDYKHKDTNTMNDSRSRNCGSTALALFQV